MNSDTIVRAWEDDEYRSKLSPEEQAKLPGNPAGMTELTTGLDPQARRQTWELISNIRERGKTVVLVTHFMEEVERLCDRIAVINQGRVVALDTPERLIATLQQEWQSAPQKRATPPAATFEDVFLSLTSQRV